MQYRIHLLINAKFLGDKNQALGIKTKLVKQYGSAITQIKEWNDSKDEELVNLNYGKRSPT